MQARFRAPARVTVAEARELQRRLRDEVVEEGDPRDVHLVAGVDLSGTWGGGTATAAAVLLSYPGLEVLEHHLVRGQLEFPYIPGLLSFREAPLMLEALGGLKRQPHLVLVDGQGRAHPRGLGIASHLGLILGVPVVGCAKSRLVGSHEDPPAEAGNWVSLILDGRVVGAVFRTKTRVRPIYVSVGHLISLESALRFVAGCTLPGRRIPEPIMRAHILAGLDRTAHAG